MTAGSPYRAALGPSCGLHAGTPSEALCLKCGAPLCGRCAVMLVNGDPWCEPCGLPLARRPLPWWAPLFALIALGWIGPSLVFRLPLQPSARFQLLLPLVALYFAAFFTWVARGKAPLDEGVQPPRLERRAAGGWARRKR